MITIVLVIYNGGKYIKNCLDSISLQTYHDFKILVVDNHSTDNSLDLLSKYKVDEWIRNEENLGWAVGNNIGIAHTKTKYALLLNIDTILAPDCLAQLMKCAKQNPDAALVSPSILEYKDYPKSQVGYPLLFDLKNGLIRAAIPTNEIQEVSFVPGTAMFVNLELLGEEAYFVDKFFMYHEDIELSLRILSKPNLKLFFCPASYVWHDSKQSFSKESTCRLALKNLFKCLIEFQSNLDFIKHYPNYINNLVKNYSFYKEYYKLVYPINSIKYSLLSLVWLFTPRRRFNVKERIEMINEQVLAKGEKFNFIF